MRDNDLSRSSGVAPTITRRSLIALAAAMPAAAFLTPSTALARPLDGSRKAAYWTHGVDQSALRPVQASHLGGDIAMREAGDKLVSTGQITTDSFRLVAVSWPSEASSAQMPQVFMRTRTRSGWGQWSALHPDTHGPDDGTPEARANLPATQLRIVEQSDALELVLASPDDMPAGISIHLVQPGDDLVGVQTSSIQATNSEQPAILTRADWEADETIRESGDPDYGQIRGAFVHHTVDLNSYSADDVPAIIRSIYMYHVETRNWRDIGYNFLIDRFGRIWEGRYGGIEEPVVGAHTAGYNSSSFGVAVIGNYMSKVPEQDVLRAYRSLIAWKFSLHGVVPLSLVSYPSQQTLSAISGHRDAGATLCPGDQLYDAIPALRREVHLALRSARAGVLVPPIESKPKIPPAD